MCTSLMDERSGQSPRSVMAILRQSMYYAACHLGAPVVTLLSVLVYTRLMIPEQYGIYLILLSSVNFLLLGLGWVDSSVLRLYRRYQLRSEEGRFVSTVLLVILICVMVVGSVAFFVVPMAVPLAAPWGAVQLLVLVAVVGSEAGVRCVLNLARTREQAKTYALTFAVHTTARYLFGILAYAAIYRSVFTILLAWAVVGVAVIVVLGVRLGLGPILSVKEVSLEIARGICAYGLPFVPAGAFVLVMDQFDRYVLMHFHGSAEVGVYGAAYTISGYALISFSSVIMMSAYPTVVNVCEEQGQGEALRLLAKLMRIHVIMSAGALLILVVLGRDVMRAVFPPGYEAGITVIGWIGLGVFANTLLQYYTKQWILAEKSVEYAGILGAGAAVSVMMNFLLIPTYGTSGAAVGVTLSYGSALLLAICMTRRLAPGWGVGFADYAKIGIAATGAALALREVREWLPQPLGAPRVAGMAVAGAVMYMGFLLALREVSREELASLNSLWRSGSTRWRKREEGV